MKSRLFAALSEGTYSSKVKHYRGMPPELAGGTDTRKEMGSARFLVIEINPDGVFLYRFDAEGDCVGDTWHMTVEHAKDQAAYEFEGLPLNWQDIPQSVEDVAAFVRDHAGQG